MVIIEGKDFTKLVIIIFLLGVIGWSFSLFGNGEPGTNPGQPIYDLKKQQYQVTVEADRIGKQLGDIGQSVQSADRAVECGQEAATAISAGINQCQGLLRECRSLTEANSAILAEFEISAGAGTKAAERPGK